MTGLGIAILGPKAFDLAATQGTSGSISGSVILSPRQAAALRQGHFYIQINSQKAPDGNLTGWLLPPHPFAGEDVPFKARASCPNVTCLQNEKLFLLPLLLLGVSATALENGPFTPDQAGQGRGAYLASCAACHGAQLKGAGEAPPLAGETFMAAWSKRGSDELYNLIKASMPYGNGNSLDAAIYRNITAYLLAANGAHPNGRAFTGAESVKIASVADGKTTDIAAPATQRAMGVTPPATSYPPGRFGVTVRDRSRIMRR